MFRICALLLTIGLVVPVFAVAGPARSAFQGDPQAVAEYTAAYEKFGDARTWRSKMTAPGMQGSVTFEYVAPDRMRMIIGMGNQMIETIVIGNTQWSRIAGTCNKTTVKMETQDPREGMRHEADATVQVAKGGAEAVEGTPTQIYNVTITAKGKTVQQKVYVATQTGYPRRLETQGPQGTMITDYWDFNAAIVIEPPC